MKPLTCTSGEFDDLFGRMAPPGAVPGGGRLAKRRPPLEMKIADALCRQLRRKQAPREKRRIGHLICLNLLSMLRKSPH